MLNFLAHGLTWPCQGMFFEGDIHRTIPEAQTTTLMFKEDALGFVLHVHKHTGFVCLILAVIIPYFLDLCFLMIASS